MKGDTFRWDACVGALTPEHLEKLASWRGYSLQFCIWLQQQSMVGLFEGDRIAFPVHDESGTVAGCHYRIKEDHSWRYFPSGMGTRPLIFGNPKEAGFIMVFESQWDALAVMDKLGWHTTGLPDTAVIITRGAANGRLVKGLCSSKAIAYAWPQNDDEPNPQNWENSSRRVAEGCSWSCRL